jgi:HAMP domain-containing protein
VARERIGDFEYLLAAAPVIVRTAEALLTVPLTSQQREIDAQIDALDRRVLLAALLFLPGGAGLGYTMAERIADPVNRLTRATARIARGDSNVHVAATSSDELRRLAKTSTGWRRNCSASAPSSNAPTASKRGRNGAAGRARDQEPAHPDQLNAEAPAARHADRGEPLGPVLKECVETILAQVRLLRRFRQVLDFASSPTARPSSGARARISCATSSTPTAPGSPGVSTSGRHSRVAAAGARRPRACRPSSLTNIVENALHAMPGRGTLTVSAATGPVRRHPRLDTGGGMDLEALARAVRATPPRDRHRARAADREAECRAERRHGRRQEPPRSGHDGDGAAARGPRLGVIDLAAAGPAVSRGCAHGRRGASPMLRHQSRVGATADEG